MQELLGEYFQGPLRNRLQVLDVPIDLGKDVAQLRWVDEAAKMVQDLDQFQHVVVFVTTHSDPDRGDLWLGRDERNQVCAVSVKDVCFVLFFAFDFH